MEWMYYERITCLMIVQNIFINITLVCQAHDVINSKTSENLSPNYADVDNGP